METFRTQKRNRTERADPLSLERGIRQMLSDKVSGDMVGLWLLAPEHLRLGTWDLLCSWTGREPNQIEPRLGLQLVHEAALCVTGVRQQRALAEGELDTRLKPSVVLMGGDDGPLIWM